MRGKILILLAAVMPVLSAYPEEQLAELKANGVIYTNVTITKVSATDLFFTSSNGMGNIKLKDLDRKTQKHFHYDAGKARAAEKKHAASAAQYHAQAVRDYAQPAAPTNSATGISEGKPIWAKSFLNQQGPELFVERWLSPLPDYRGKFILYVFWNTASPASRAAIKELNEYQREFSDRLAIIAISDEHEEVVRPVTDPVADFAVAIDTQGRTRNAVGVSALPHLMLIDPKGYVRWEGYPFLAGHEFSNKVLTDVMGGYDKAVAQMP